MRQAQENARLISYLYDDQRPDDSRVYWAEREVLAYFGVHLGPASERALGDDIRAVSAEVAKIVALLGLHQEDESAVTALLYPLAWLAAFKAFERIGSAIEVPSGVLIECCIEPNAAEARKYFDEVREAQAARQ